MIYVIHSHHGLMLPMQLAALRRFIPGEPITIAWAPVSADPRHGAGPLRLDESWVARQYVGLIEAPRDLVGYVGVHRVRAMHRWLWTLPAQGRYTVILHGDVIPTRPINLAAVLDGRVMAGAHNAEGSLIHTGVRIFDRSHSIDETWEGASLVRGEVDGHPYRSLPVSTVGGFERIGPFAHLGGMTTGDAARRRMVFAMSLASIGVVLPVERAPTVPATSAPRLRGMDRRVEPWPLKVPLWRRPGDVLRALIRHATEGRATHGIECEQVRRAMNAGGWRWVWRERRAVMARLVNEARAEFARSHPDYGAWAVDEWHPIGAAPVYFWRALRHWVLTRRLARHRFIT